VPGRQGRCADYVDVMFNANAGTAYTIWLRLKALSNIKFNDSVWVQFSDATSGGQPVYSIGTTSGLLVNLATDATASSLNAWGWQNGAYWLTQATTLTFATNGPHTLRVQVREDGVQFDQIVLSPDQYLSTAPGPRDNDTHILPANDGSSSPPPPPPPPPSDPTIVLWTANTAAQAISGNWQLLTDASAAGGKAIWNVDGAQPKISPALAAPPNEFEMTFTATAGIPYQLWVRMRPQNNALSNDSIHLQFNDSVTSSGAATMRIGTSSSSEVILQNGASAPGGHGWGWADNGWDITPIPIYFAATGTHTVRVQQREDGAIVDQIVLSPNTYMTTPPGARLDDTTILPANNGTP